MKDKVINRFYHEHPLILTEIVSHTEPLKCYGCGEPVTNLEAVYVCKEKYCSGGPILHRECGELPNQLCHPKHPQHSLHLFDYHSNTVWCDICLHDLSGVLGYQCSSCYFDVDLNCKKLIDMEKQLSHPSHPNHPLTLMRKPALAFCCDGCGDQEVDMAYICSVCEFWIHKACASLPRILSTNHHHHHLSLAFSFPTKHLDYIFDCDVCDKRLNRTCWVYFCSDCRFYAHVKCVTSTTKQVSNIGEVESHGSDVIQFPLHAQDISVKLITPFVMKGNKIPHLKDMPTTIKMPETSSAYSFLFNYHKHSLTLVSEHHKDHKKIIDEDEDEEEEDDTTNDRLKICDVCVTPIPSPPYYVCLACKYFVHSICYSLPKTLPSSSSSANFSNLYGTCPNPQNENHIFTLYTSSTSIDMSSSPECMHCHLITNGRVYECEGCDMKIDVKCASLPQTIRHASHPHHKSLVMTRIPLPEGGKRLKFHCCRSKSDFAYYCSLEDCNFALHSKCVMLPLIITDLEWDRHQLLLTFDAYLDHPSDFICGFCEEEMNPKLWMYHCRQCDNSFHPSCLKATSGAYKNVKFARKFVLDGIHPHPLTFNCITIKKRCDICRATEYDYHGLECALCNYLMCKTCARKALASVSFLPR